MAGVGGCFDRAVVEVFWSSLEWEVLSRFGFDNPEAGQAIVLDWS